MAKKKKGSWIVRLKCVVIKEVYCSNCTEEEATQDPWDHVVGDEAEVTQDSWEVQSIEPNE